MTTAVTEPKKTVDEETLKREAEVAEIRNRIISFHVIFDAIRRTFVAVVCKKVGLPTARDGVTPKKALTECITAAFSTSVTLVGLAERHAPAIAKELLG